MPRIFDNIEQPLLDTLLETLDIADRADFSVGYLNLRGWKELDERVERWAGSEPRRHVHGFVVLLVGGPWAIRYLLS